MPSLQAASVLFPPHSLRTLCMMDSSSDFNTLLTENAGLSAFSEILLDEIVSPMVSLIVLASTSLCIETTTSLSIIFANSRIFPGQL